MNLLRLAPVLLSGLLLCAHFLRTGSLGHVAACVAALALLATRRSWVSVVGPWLLLVAALIWTDTTVELVWFRRAFGAPWGRLVAILGGVIAVTLASALVFRWAPVRRRFARAAEASGTSAAAFMIAAALLTVIQVKVARPMLLLERYWPGGGWLEIIVLAAYAAWVAEKLLDTKTSALWRRRIWSFFSIVFFAQLILGLAGIEQLLMSGRLHLPVPALIVAGPLFRGSGFFMPILFGVTVLILGPAWCSHLCYIGAWDNAAADSRRRPGQLPRWAPWVRVGLLLAVIAGAVGLRLAGTSSTVAAVTAGAFGVLGVVLMLVWSRRTGVMAHCVVFCPMGLLANLLGKLSPFRIRIGEGCTDCGVCTRACRFDALGQRDIEERRPGFTCTLCGDCLGSCKQAEIDYRFARFSGPRVRAAFIALIAATHAIFLGVARM